MNGDYLLFTYYIIIYDEIGNIYVVYTENLYHPLGTNTIKVNS